MTTLQRLDSDDPRVGGVRILFTPTYGRDIAWAQGQPINPVIDAAKQYVAQLMDGLAREDSVDSRSAIRETNWVSLTAGVASIISEWNGLLVADLRRQAAARDMAMH